MRYLDLDVHLCKLWFMNICERTTCMWWATVQTVKCWAIDTGVLTRDTHKKQDKVEHNIYRVSVCEGRCVNEKERIRLGRRASQTSFSPHLTQCDFYNVLLIIFMQLLGFKAVLWLLMYSNDLHLKGGGGIPEQLPIRVKLIKIEGGSCALLSCFTVGFYIYCWFP